MTEEFKKWWSQLTYQPSHPANDAHHVISCFVAEVEKRTSELRKECANPREAAFSLLSRELLGEK